MRIDLNFVELHSPLFLDGTNWGTKLYADPKKNSKGALELWYETDLEHTFVVHNGVVAMIEATASKTVADLSQLKAYVKETVKNPLFGKSRAHETLNSIPGTHAERAGVSIKAQVSGPGIGLKQTAQVSTPLDKVQGTPGRKAKYQGEESQGE